MNEAMIKTNVVSVASVASKNDFKPGKTNQGFF